MIALKMQSSDTVESDELPVREPLVLEHGLENGCVESRHISTKQNKSNLAH